MAVSDKNLIWIDCEMTGLDPESDRLIEIGVIITDSQLNLVAEGPGIVISQPQALLDSMDEWNTNTHTKSGLVERVQDSNINEATAERTLIDFLSKYVPAGVSPMCGNSVHQDRRFLDRYMPNLASYFHYRNLDVSSIKILAERWAYYLVAGVDKRSKHLVMDDIKDSINELKYYRENFFQFVHDPFNT